MLALEVNLLTNRFVATAYNDRNAHEWPPHPARVFSALVEAHFAGAADAAERAALEWLEAQGPPAIEASGCSVRESVKVFVPVNDTTAVGNIEEQWITLEELRREPAGNSGDATRPSVAARDLEKREKQFQETCARLVATGGRITASDLKAGRNIQPEFRPRQPRTFPSVTPHSPRVVYTWVEAEPTAETVAALDRIAGRVTRLGHSSSLVSMRIREEPGARTWRPAAGGPQRLRTVTTGQLVALEQTFARFRETDPRLLPSVFTSYESGPEARVVEAPHSLWGEDWLVLRRATGPSLPSTSTWGLAKAVRKILMRYADQPVHEFVSGHAPQGAPSTDDHLAIVPLPFVGSQWADGRIVGLGIVLPDGTADRDRDALFRAIAAWEDDSRRDDEDTPLLPILLGAAGVLSVIRVEGEARERALSPSTWCRESRRWASATPVMLDHNPGDLRSRDPEKLRKIQAEARASIRRACERIGLPPPETVIVQRAAPLAGGEKVRAFAAVADRSGPVRILTHAVIEFATPVRGPILIGAGRYHGLGLMRPVVDHE